MPIGYGGNSARVETTSGSATPTLPAGTAAGDLLLMHLAHGSTAVIAAPSGWTLATSVQISTTHRQHLFWKFAGAGESNPTFGGGGSNMATTNGAWGVLTRWTGVPVSGDPFDGTPTGATGSGGSMTGATMTPSVDGCMAVWFWTQSDNGTTSTVNNGATVAFSGSSYDSIVGIDSNQSAGYKLMATATATGATTMTSSSGAAWSCIRLLLDPTETTVPIAANDSLTVTDTLKVGVSGADTVTVTDDARVGIPTPAADSATITESLGIAGTLSAPDTVAVTDSLGIVGSFTATDSVAITDAPKVGPKATDSLAISDAVTDLVGHLGVTDPFTFSDGAAVETLFGDLIIALFAVDPANGSLIPLPDHKSFTMNRERNGAGSISLTYPVDGLNFTTLRNTITDDRDLEVEIWTIGSPTGALRGFLQEASGDDVKEDRVWTFAGQFGEILVSEAVCYPAPIITITTVTTTTKLGENNYQIVKKTTTASSEGGPPSTTTVTTTATTGTEGTTTTSTSTNGDLEFKAVTPGALAITLIDQAQDRGALDGLILGFTATHDSAGVAWPKTITTKFSPGSAYNQVLQRLVDFGLAEWGVTWTGSAYRLDLWVIFGRGTDRTTGLRPIVLRKARNLLDSPRKWTVRDSATAMLSSGSEGVYEEAEDVDALARRGRRIERASSAGNLTTTEAVQGFAQNQLELLSVGRLEINHGIGFLPGEPRPIIGFDIGDWIYSQSSAGLERLRVVQWTLSVDTDQGASGTVTLNDTITDWLSRLKAQLANLTAGDTVVGTSQGSGGQDTSAPMPPQVLSADSIAFLDGTLGVRAAVTVVWEPPVLNVDGTVITDMDGFNVQSALATSPDVWDAGITVGGNADHATFTAPAGQTINIRVNAFDRNGNTSEWSFPAYPHTTASDDIPPPVPSAAVVSEFLGTIRITWDGLTDTGAVMSEIVDFDHVEVHMSTGSLFTPSDSTLVGRLFGRGTYTVTDLPYGTTQYARFVAMDWSNNKSDPSAQGSATPAQVVSADVFDGAIGSAKLADLAVITAKINDLAVNNAKIADLSVGKLTAGTFTADMTLSGIIKTASSGNRVEIDNAGVRLYNSTNIMVDFKTSNGSALVVGEFRTSLTGQRIVFNPGGALADTMNFYPSAAGDFARIMARTSPGDGTAAVLIDGGAANGTARGRLGAYKGEAFVSHVKNDSGGDTSAGFSTTAVSCTPTRINVWVTDQLYFWKINGTTSAQISGSLMGLFWANGDAGTGATPTISANNAGVKLDVDFVCITTGTGNAFGAVKATAFTVASGQDTKTDIQPVREALPAVRAAQGRTFRYREEVARRGTKARRRYGVLAEEMPAELVMQSPAADGSGPEKSLNLADWLGLVHAAVAELADTTDARLDALEAGLKELM